MDLNIIILNFNTKGLLENCLKSIFHKKWSIDFMVTVVDNGSSDDSVKMIKRKFPQVKVVESEKNLGFTGGNNLGLKLSTSRYSLVLNSDTEVFNKSLDSIVDFMDNSDYGIASCKLVNSEGKFQSNAGQLPTFLSMFFWLSGMDDIFGKIFPINSYQERSMIFYSKNREAGWVSGTAMIIKKEVIDKIGYFDENIFMYCEDVEYCLRAHQAGYKIGWTNQAEIMHLGGGSQKDPSFKQWIGEFRGLLYVYNKYYGGMAAFFLKILIYFFAFIRVTAFLVMGKPRISQTYAKIIFNL